MRTGMRLTGLAAAALLIWFVPLAGALTMVVVGVALALSLEEQLAEPADEALATLEVHEAGAAGT